MEIKYCHDCTIYSFLVLFFFFFSNAEKNLSELLNLKFPVLCKAVIPGLVWQ